MQGGAVATRSTNLPAACLNVVLCQWLSVCVVLCSAHHVCAVVCGRSVVSVADGGLHVTGGSGANRRCLHWPVRHYAVADVPFSEITLTCKRLEAVSNCCMRNVVGQRAIWGPCGALIFFLGCSSQASGW